MIFTAWIKQQIRFIEEHESHPERDLVFYEDLRAIVAEAERRSTEAGLPSAVKACNIRSGPITPHFAREVLAKCLAACSGATELTPPQVAKRFSVKPETVIRWIRSGRLQAVNVAKTGKRPRWRISKTALDDFSRERSPTKTASQPRSRIPLVPFSRY